MGSNEEKNKTGQAAMVSSLVAFEQDSFNLALAGQAGQGGGFTDLADDYSGTDAGQLSKYYAGVSYLNTGKIDEGMEMLESYKKGSTFVGAAAHAALGYAHEQKGAFAEAAEAYETASRTPSENAVSTPFYLMHAARNHESAGKNDAALELYRQIKTKYPLSAEGASVDKYIARLAVEDED
jgi:tetratricopeptide (TPR) repeat protein